MPERHGKKKLVGGVPVLAPCSKCPVGTGVLRSGRYGIYYACVSCSATFKTADALKKNNEAKRKDREHLKEVYAVQRAETESNRIRTERKAAMRRTRSSP